MKEKKELTPRQVDFETAIKEQADPECNFCLGTGFFVSGWMRGLVCSCVENAQMDRMNGEE